MLKLEAVKVSYGAIQAVKGVNLEVRSGEVIGLLGDTGVKESAPHLHFSVSIRAGKDWPEKYIDPEPLIALWPLRVPLDGSEVGLVTTTAPTGVPLGSLPVTAAHRRKQLAKQKRASDKSDSNRSATTDDAPGDEEPPAEAETPESSVEE
jgi:murein DD-endopeptidase MepM/ murein hydrolase activator NlpD